MVNIKEDNDLVNNKETNDFVKTKEDNDLVNIKDDNDFVNNINKKICVVYIQKTNLYDKTINISKHRNFIEIFDFFLLINNIILLYCNINELYIKGLINNSFQRKSNYNHVCVLLIQFSNMLIYKQLYFIIIIIYIYYK